MQAGRFHCEESGGLCGKTSHRSPVSLGPSSVCRQRAEWSSAPSDLCGFKVSVGARDSLGSCTLQSKLSSSKSCLQLPLMLVCAGVQRAHLKSQGFHVFINQLLFFLQHAVPQFALLLPQRFFLEGKKTMPFLKSEQVSIFPDRISSECASPPHHQSYAAHLTSSTSSEHDFFFWKHGQST